MAAKGSAKLKDDVRQLERVPGRAGADTIRLWESYREQAFLWRALALLQMPATALSIGAALVMFFFADTIVEVPDRPQPGIYSTKQLPDTQFIDAATQVVNLIATYQPANADAQFKAARRYLWEPALSEFQATMIKNELRLIEETQRSQVFVVNTRAIKVERYREQEYVVVRIPGVRYKLIGEKSMQPENFIYYVKMTTIPKNVFNEYGIVITDIRADIVTQQPVN